PPAAGAATAPPTRTVRPRRHRGARPRPGPSAGSAAVGGTALSVATPEPAATPEAAATPESAATPDSASASESATSCARPAGICRDITATWAALGRSCGFAPRQAAHNAPRLAGTGSVAPEPCMPAPGALPAIPVRHATNTTPSEYMSAAADAGPPLASSGAG